MAFRFSGVMASLIIRKRNLFRIVHMKHLSKGNSCRRMQGKAEK